MVVGVVEFINNFIWEEVCVVLIFVEVFDVGVIYFVYNFGLSLKEDFVDIKVEIEKCCILIELNEMICCCNIF